MLQLGTMHQEDLIDCSKRASVVPLCERLSLSFLKRTGMWSRISAMVIPQKVCPLKILPNFGYFW